MTFDAAFKAEDVFGFELNNPETGEPILLPGYSEPDEALTPAPIEGYEFRKELVMPFLASLFSQQPLLFVGEAGEGKTSFIQQVAFMLNWRLVLVSSSEETEVPDLVGSRYIDEDGKMPFRLAALLDAAQKGYQVLFDEIHKMRPGVLAKFNAFFEGAPFVVDATGEVIQQADSFRLFATANTRMAADFSGRYAASQAGDMATAARFLMVPVERLDRDARDRLLSRFIPDPDHRDAMLQMADLIAGSKLSVPFGTRELVRWGQFSAMFANHVEAFKLVYANRFEDEGELRALDGHYRATMGVNLLPDVDGVSS